MSKTFESVEQSEIIQLVADYPLAWIVPVTEPYAALQMPVLAETDAHGRLDGLLGHLPRRHPAVQLLPTNPEVVLLFQGPNAYISPAHLSDKDWAPTWNFASIRMLGRIEMSSDLTDQVLERTVAHMESSRETPWTARSLGSRYALLRHRVIGFRIRLIDVQPRFKLGQDERTDVLKEIIDGLGDHPIAAWMAKANSAS